MLSYFLRIEGVNLANVIDDTDDLSTRRGGGLMVLEAAAGIVDRLPAEIRMVLTPLATGASIGLYQFEAPDDRGAELVRTAVERTLREPSSDELPLHQGTFVVDFTRDTGDNLGDVERVTALNRWRQLREPSLALHDIWAQTNAKTFCARDRVRPAVRQLRGPDASVEWVSTSVSERRAFGREARQQFYRRELNRQPPFEFTNDLLSLARQPTASERGEPWQVVPESTDGKIAVFYVDGNRFGALTRERLSRGTRAYHDWSEALRNHHRRVLDGLLRRIENDPTWRSDGAARMETLLWGGDEILWVVPAWKGWELVEWFFAESHVVESESLTYGGGVVFCHANAPIKNVTHLAHSLADLAKHAGKESGENRVAYEVLESFDDITGDLSAHRKRWLPADRSPDSLLINPARLGSPMDGRLPNLTGWDALRRLAAERELPARQLYQLCKSWRRGQPWTLPRARIADAVSGQLCDAVEAAFGDAPAAWLHVLQMLPYLPTDGGAKLP